MLFYHIGHEPVFAYICVPQKDIFELLDSDGNICAGRNRLPGRSWAGIRKRREKWKEGWGSFQGLSFLGKIPVGPSCFKYKRERTEDLRNSLFRPTWMSCYPEPSIPVCRRWIAVPLQRKVVKSEKNFHLGFILQIELSYHPSAARNTIG